VKHVVKVDDLEVVVDSDVGGDVDEVGGDL
jgi:hypothetical protein